MIPDTIQLVYDRTNQDLAKIKALLKKPKKSWTDADKEYYDAASSKGSYNYTDLNRVTKAIEHFVGVVSGYGYDPKYKKIKIERKEESVLPDGYKQLQYIRSTGTQYINTGIDPNNSIEVSVDMQLDSDVTADCNPFSVYGSTNRFFTKYTNNKYQGGLGTIWFKETGYSGNAHERLTLKLGNGYFAVGDASVKVTESAFTVGRPLYIFASNSKGNVVGFTKMSLYSCTITESDKLIRDYKPCIDSENRIGLYDTVSNSFIGNSGTGSFIAGPEIPKQEPKNPYTWYESDEPSLEQLEQYLLNVKNLCATVMQDFSLPESMRKLSVQDANDIEKIFIDLDTVIERVVRSMCRSNAFTFWSGNRPLPSADSDLGRTWKELDAMNTEWRNWQVADWYLLLYGNLKAEGDVV